MKCSTKEAEVIILCSRIKMSNEQKEQVAQLIACSDFNWFEFLNHVMEHKVSGLIANNIVKVTNLPKGIRKLFTQITSSNSEKSRLYIAEIEKLFKVFNEADLKVVLFKGPRLLNDVFPEFSLRTFSDLDILISSNDYPEIKRILHNHGYDQGEVVNGKFVRMNEALLTHNEKNLQHYGTFVRKGESDILPWLEIDVHTRFTTVYDDISYNVTRVMDEAIKTKMGSTDVFIFNSTDHIIHLCLHLYWHTRSIMNIAINDDLRLSRFVDIYESINNLEIDWSKLLNIVKEETGLQQAVAYTLILTEKIYGEIIPQYVREGMWKEDDIEKHVDSISERWINESISTIGYWDIPFEERLFNNQRVNEAYRIFYDFVRNSKKREIRKL
ncbi:nucleotidyltransferase domain-containing protein [Paenibacillus glucanolyticus]|uniref:nucleotidyltransferase domain-containing protein n=1 Tax=Paenibacillus glucanolyticus TaxID=59843 RepID=UPI00096D821D|nr:nucleotidyltransferase family protein [Paenibacillus glucanolyticus]OMF81586.1 hypothetical protein BK142_03670 [Paenibacillus glucanolyticus]